MKRVFAATVVVGVGLLAARGLAQTPAALPTVDQVLEKNITALGGRAAIEKITSRVAKGTMEIPDAGISGSLQISEKAPDKSLAVIELSGMGTIREGTDAAGAWEENPQTGLRDKTGSELADARRGATFNPELKMKTIYKTLAVTGMEKAGTRDAYVVLATPAEGSPTRMYFDAENGLMLRQQVTRDTPQGPVDVDVYLEDYREVDGIKQPFTVRQITAQFSILIRLTEITHNVALDDAIFKRPGAPLAAR
jgi:hypothetical protein